MNKELFATLLDSSEGKTLDFKKQQYDFSNDSNATAKFVKDIVSFCNTERESSGYIIIGIDESSKENRLIGINTIVDDAIFQEKIKDKVSPKPEFSVLTFDYKDQTFAIIEIPVKRYDMPITPVVRMNGLEIGKIYFRRGSSNQEANSLESINIYNWIRNVEVKINKNKLDELEELLTETMRSEYFSSFLPRIKKLAADLNDQVLYDFCSFELLGWPTEQPKIGAEHRSIHGFWSFHKIVQTRYPKDTSIHVMWNELKENKDFHDFYMSLGDPIASIEDQLRTLRDSKMPHFVTLTKPVKELLPNSNKDTLIYIYWNDNDMSNLYRSTRQKLINLVNECIVKNGI